MAEPRRSWGTGRVSLRYGLDRVAEVRPRFDGATPVSRVLSELAAQLDAFDTDPGVDCIVVAPASEIDFCGPADRVAADELSKVVHRLISMSTPSIAVVQGRCGSAGLRLVLACDIAIASDTARFEAHLDDHGERAAAALSTRIGRVRAMWMLMHGASVHADDAEFAGLIDLSVPYGRLDDEIARHARAVCRALDETRELTDGD